MNKLIIALLLVCQSGFAQQKLEGNDGHGGGGVTRNGRYMTFYSAGFYTEPLEATSDEVPQLEELITFFKTTPLMSELTKVKYASELIPGGERKYYKVQGNTFTPEVRTRLLAEYGRVMKVDTNEVALFAITDTQSGITYLFPEFYSLKPSEQQAILFHEAYWLVNPKATYARVIDAEMSFQAYIENPQSSEKLIRWLRNSGTTGDTFLAALKSDLSSGAMQGLVTNNKIPIRNLLGDKFIECKSSGLGAECAAFITSHAYQLSYKYPRSLFIKIYLEAAGNNQVDLISSASPTGEINTYSILNDLNGNHSKYPEILRKNSFDFSTLDYTAGVELISPFSIHSSRHRGRYIRLILDKNSTK